MKMIYLSNICGAFDAVASLLSETIADVYILTGNLIDIPFYNENLDYDYYALQKYFIQSREMLKIVGVPLEDFVDTLLHMPDTPEEIQEKGNRYLHYSIRARRVMQEKYKMLENICLFKTTASIYALPGNHDMNLTFTALHQRDLHRVWHVCDGMKLAGYGGADIWSPGVPEKYALNYDLRKSEVENEMYTFFKAIQPDIIVAYQPAYGCLDLLANATHCGSKVLRSYCDAYRPTLCLTGNTYKDWGFKVQNGCVHLNPSNFGNRVVASAEVIEGGCFYQIEFDGDTLARIVLKKIIGHTIHDLADYYIRNGLWRENVIDTERFLAKKELKNYDFREEQYVNVPEIELFKDIKRFYRLFQTQETEARVVDLEQAVAAVNATFGEIALDVVGSVNMGLSQKSSDIDAVLYVRCGSTCGDMIETCEYSQTAKKMITDILQNKYKVDIVDCINLNKVEQSIIVEDYDCEMTQRFVAYRSICRPINYKLIAPIEDVLNEKSEYRSELEGSVRAYLKIFATTSTHVQSFDKYEARLKSIGVQIPEFISKKIKEYLQKPS